MDIDGGGDELPRTHGAAICQFNTGRCLFSTMMLAVSTCGWNAPPAAMKVSAGYAREQNEPPPAERTPALQVKMRG